MINNQPFPKTINLLLPTLTKIAPPRKLKIQPNQSLLTKTLAQRPLQVNQIKLASAHRTNFPPTPPQNRLLGYLPFSSLKMCELKWFASTASLMEPSLPGKSTKQPGLPLLSWSNSEHSQCRHQFHPTLNSASNAPPAHMLSTEFLSPSSNEQWYCPDVIDFPLLSTFGNKDIPPQSYISTAAKTPHPESTLVRFLYHLLHPAQTSISDWAKLVAASVELMADSLYVPPAPTAVHDEDQLIQGVQVLQHIEAIKNSSSSFDTVEDNPGEDSQPTQRSHSIDVLHEFQNSILDVLSAYVIFQTHALSEPPLTDAQKKTNSRNLCTTTRNPSGTVITSENKSLDLANIRAESNRQLQSYQHRQNYQPLIFFVLAGVRGLFLASRNHRHASTIDCMSFNQAITAVTTGSKTPDKVLNKALLINPEAESLAPASTTKSYALTPLPQMSTPQVPLQAPASVFLINKYSNKHNPKYFWFKILPTPSANPAVLS
ncbi:hypothetical protein PtB15_5B728 [Puccinia triticina]|nr:hypothetical protein PtB15_5B728 [Puccinia triticina]